MERNRNRRKFVTIYSRGQIMKITTAKLFEVINQEIEKVLAEISDDQVDRLLDIMKAKKAKRALVNNIEKNPEASADLIFQFLGPDGIQQIMDAMITADPAFATMQHDHPIDEKDF